MIQLTTIDLPATPPGTPGPPLLADGHGRSLDADARLLLEVGPDHVERPASLLPWRLQSGYDRDPVTTPTRVAVLDNGRLRATFLLDWGGRLWNLVDLATGRDVLMQPDSLQLANLALRDAWFSGGVEWNLGITGHWALTASPVSAAVLEVEGEQVLRLWAYERMLELVWRLDVWLPEGSDALYVRPVVHNPHDTDRPVYWWSNIAVPQTPGTRVLVDADSSFHYGPSRPLLRADVPEFEGVDITRPALAVDSADYFFDLDPALTHPWIASVEPDGSGFRQASTALLRGRKLFVWGTGRGGERWQGWLNGTGRYAEIQAGVARTQFEHLRLAPGARWAWTESYEPLTLSEADAAAPFADAVAAAAPDAERRGGIDRAEAFLARVAELGVPGGWVPAHGGAEQAGWGGVAVALRDLPADPATPFPLASRQADSTFGTEQRLWLRAGAGDFGAYLAATTLTGEGWLRRLRALAAEPGRDAEPGLSGSGRAMVLAQWGFAEWAAGHPDAARAAWEASRALRPSAPVARALALTGDPASADRLDLLAEATRLDPGDAGVALEYAAALVAAGRYEAARGVLAERAGQDGGGALAPRIAYLTAAAAVGMGDAETARRILSGPLVVPDLREGEVSLGTLWDAYQRLIGSAEPLPEAYDFRMHVTEPPERSASAPQPPA